MRTTKMLSSPVTHYISKIKGGEALCHSSMMIKLSTIIITFFSKGSYIAYTLNAGIMRNIINTLRTITALKVRIGQTRRKKLLGQ
jgi:hypothetical protein